MTDPADLTPEQDAVRRLLAAARHDGPTPPEVVGRLDETLASLVAERDGGTAPTAAPVVDLAARRRRTARIGLLAAAAVVVAGVAVGQVLPRTPGGQSDSGSAGSDMATAQDRELSDDSGGADADSGMAEQSPESLKSSATAPEAPYPTLSSGDAGLDDEVLGLRSVRALGSTELDTARTLAGCDLRGIGRGRRVGAQVDGFPGVVVFRRPDGAAQQVDLFLCGTSVPVRTLTLPAP